VLTKGEVNNLFTAMQVSFSTKILENVVIDEMFDDKNGRGISY